MQSEIDQHYRKRQPDLDLQRILSNSILFCPERGMIKNSATLESTSMGEFNTILSAYIYMYILNKSENAAHLLLVKMAEKRFYFNFCFVK